jgi:uncharacterized protein (DUF433 family)
MIEAMATAAKGQTYPQISKTPDVCGGKACIDGTRIRVMDIVILEERGLRPEEMLDQYARPLTLAQIHSALAYSYDHREEIARSFAKEREVVARIEKKRGISLQLHR